MSCCESSIHFSGNLLKPACLWPACMERQNPLAVDPSPVHGLHMERRLSLTACRTFCVTHHPQTIHMETHPWAMAISVGLCHILTLNLEIPSTNYYHLSSWRLLWNIIQWELCFLYICIAKEQDDKALASEHSCYTYSCINHVSW